MEHRHCLSVNPKLEITLLSNLTTCLIMLLVALLMLLVGLGFGSLFVAFRWFWLLLVAFCCFWRASDVTVVLNWRGMYRYQSRRGSVSQRQPLI